MTQYRTILVDRPVEGVSRVTLNRPEKRNAISTPMRAELLSVLEANDRDDAVRVTVIRGAGECFSAGYDLGGDLMADPPYHTAPGDGAWSRHVSETWFRFWDLAKPVIAQVHGYAIAGATELAQACDLVYVADDARIAYPIVRVASPPDWQYHMPLLGVRRALEIMLTGDDLTGAEAAVIGWANRAYPAADLDTAVLDVAERVAGVASDLAQLNKRMVHRQAEVMGVRAAIRAGSEFQALASHQVSVQDFRADPLGTMKRLNAALRSRVPTAAPPRPDSEETIMAKVDPIPEGYPRVTPYLSIDGAADAITFYCDVLGAIERVRMAGPDGKIGHAELAIGESVIMLADAFPDMGAPTPRQLGGSPVTLMVYVEDVDDVFARALRAGAKEIAPVQDQFYGDRSGQFEDPFGHRWNVASHVEDVPPEEMEKRAAEAMSGG